MAPRCEIGAGIPGYARHPSPDILLTLIDALFSS
jgi:hypothetical protein